MLSKTPLADIEGPVWHRFVRFIADDGLEYCGQPDSEEVDIGLAMLNGEPVTVDILDVKSALDSDANFTGVKKRAEMKVATPEYPEVFLKPASTVTTATDPIIIPKTCHDQVDGEVELAVIIGKDCKDLTLQNAMEHVLGYTVANDVTAHPKVLELKTILNGKVMQDGKARNMIFSIEDILVYLSSGHTLKKGTVILTGTPSGIGASYDPPIYLQKGADLKVSISHGLGTLVNSIL
ncbi:hypothetical protein E4T44_02818 [Aureobasidium sp. EXF-8845]|nr:hypothetical protein E4T44_02818 [Aureobasidium sp. EXF-8845]KAI4856267.1 hypothetical protein E4T45_02279 [Aureobasidium sp. EXF-8846]